MFDDMFETLKLSSMTKDHQYLAEALTYRFVTNREKIIYDEKNFSHFLQICFATNNTPLIEETVSTRFSGFAFKIEFDENINLHHIAFLWRHDNNGLPIFKFRRQAITSFLPIVISRWLGLFDLFKLVASNNPFHLDTIVNLDDCGNGIGLNFCDRTIFESLIPDPYFFGSRGYDEMRSFYANNPIIWESRIEKVFWRGSTTGQPTGNIFTLPRVTLCMLARSHEQVEFFDFAITDAVQISKDDERLIKEKGLLGDFVPWQMLKDFKYHIDIDGNTNSWPGLFIKLLSGGLVFKIMSPFDFRQWYYERLTDGVNFVSIKSDFSDLSEKLDYYRKNQRIAKFVAQEGQKLAMSMTYDAELATSLKRISTYVMNQAQNDDK